MGKDNELDLGGLMSKMNSGGLRESDYRDYDPSKNRKGSNRSGGNNSGGKNRNNSGSYSGSRGGQGGYNGGRSGQSGYNGGRGGQGRNNNRGGGGYSDGYVGAPYNFVSVPAPHAIPVEKRAAHNAVSEEYLNGEIEIDIEAKTHLFIGDGTDKNQFVKNLYGQYVIPGSSIRGLIRSNVQILGQGDIGADVDDYSLMYRAVAGGKERKSYADILGAKIINVDGHQMGVLKNVKAGYIRHKESGDGYEILPTVTGPIDKAVLGDMNYYVLNERYIIENHQKNRSDKSFSFFFEDPMHRLQHDPYEKFKRTEKIGFRGQVMVHYRGKQNKKYLPYSMPCLYKLDGARKVTDVKPDGKPGNGYKKGYVLASGIMQEKKAIYVIPEVDTTKAAISIPKKDQEAFEIDYQKRLNILKESAGFFALPKEDEIKPVFYVELGSRLYFGFTPRPRLFYAHTVKENLAKKHPGTTFDYASSMFGYSRTEKENGKTVSKSYKSKLSFGDAVITSDGNPRDPGCTEVNIILSEPKPTSIADYLVQDGPNVTTSYNDDDFELRGVKQYWLHENADSKPPVDIEKQKKLITVMNPVKPGTRFEGKIRFHNLTKDELGLLLWSLRLEENSWMNMGRGKSFGYGAIKLGIKKVRILDMQEAYSLESMTVSPWKKEDMDVDACIEEFKRLLYHDKNGNYRESAHVKDFLAMKDSTRMPDEDKIRFMKLDDGNKVNEYKNRRALPTVQETVEK